MATVEVQTEQKQEETLVLKMVEEKTYQLTLSEKEARALKDILGKVAGGNELGEISFQIFKPLYQLFGFTGKHPCSLNTVNNLVFKTKLEEVNNE